MAASTKFVKQVWKSFLNKKGHDATCFPNLQVISARPGYVKASLRIEPYNVNRLGTLHGGLIGSLVDTMGSLAVASKGLYMTGVSTDIHTSYLRSSKPGDTIICEASLESLGKTMAFTRTEITNEGKVVAYGSHTKAVKVAYGHARNVTFDETGDKVLEGKLEDNE